MNKEVHLICNAHLDPVWLWEWEEGAAEAISTFRVAADLCEKYPNFIFNHNEAILYKWIQQFDLTLFKRIQKLVRAKRWNIMGGWFLQPDCNMSSGESLVRQILLGRNYFRQNFGVRPTTAVNVDSFGHSRGIVQILAKSGYDSYIFGRPQKQYMQLPDEEFLWKGYDGSEILASRIVGWYNTSFGKAREQIKGRIKEYGNKSCCVIFWGVGNHGGGPSKKDLIAVNRLIADSSQSVIRHSTLEIFFRSLHKTKKTIKTHRGDLNPWGVGCYTSMIRVKQKHRQLENELYMLEKMIASAWSQKLIAYPADELNEIMHDLAFCEFHDILPGTGSQAVEVSSLRLIDHALEKVSRIRTKTFLALAAGQPKAKNGRIPILIYNPHPYKIRQLFEAEFNLPDFNFSKTFTQVSVYSGNNTCLTQVEKEASNLPCDWRKRIIFEAELQPSRMNRFDCQLHSVPSRPVPKLKPTNGKIVFKTDDIKVLINTKTGLIDSYKIKGAEYITPNAFQPIVMADDEDAWGMNVTAFNKIVGRFKLMNKNASAKFAGIKNSTLEGVRVIEDGPARTVIESLFQYDQSFICQRYKLPKSGTEIEIELRVHWFQKSQMLKFNIPLKSSFCQYIGQVAYGVAQLPDNGKESVSQKWSAVSAPIENLMFTAINDGIYGSDFSKKGLRLTLLRSPVYAGHPLNGYHVLREDRYTERIDQGERIFRFWFNGGMVRQRQTAIDREALAKNEKPFVLSFFPSGQGAFPKPFAVLEDNAIQITALKKANNNSDLIIRLFEPTGNARQTTLHLPVIGKKIKLNFKPFELLTIRCHRKNRRITFVNLCEETI
ncbi:MAG: alpha-mannosidase [Planctomycetes bacterium GWF2_41_51]|nr:MAG: alpha-mannosidase [Planctomycetes bacterium GWF2_41_51]HBG26182.1 alpha-mannosidase [Phycisphaerales bacterium]